MNSPGQKISYLNSKDVVQRDSNANSQNKYTSNFKPSAGIITSYAKNIVNPSRMKDWNQRAPIKRMDSMDLNMNGAKNFNFGGLNKHIKLKLLILFNLV